jgi:hypothetical protein
VRAFSVIHPDAILPDANYVDPWTVTHLRSLHSRHV